MEHTRRKNSLSAITKARSFAEFFFVSRRNAKSMRQRANCGRRRANRISEHLRGRSGGISRSVQHTDLYPKANSHLQVFETLDCSRAQASNPTAFPRRGATPVEKAQV